ncbi:MAG TPA: GyrI-like domain-containing protein [Methylomirabilota bacterium]|jgi:AraC family transcriptional regulator
MRPDPNRLEYEKRVNRVIDHVRDHLAEELPLERLARIALFSPFHFHRVFRAVTGETLAAFVQRLRLERAAVSLIHHPDQSVLAVALDHGFSSAAGFARAFRSRFGMSATAWRAGGARRWSKRRKPVRKPGKAKPRGKGHSAPMRVVVQELPGYRVAYMRHVGPYGAGGIPALWTSLRQWMRTRDLVEADALRIGIGHDDAWVTPPEKCRYDACVVVPPSFPGDRLVNLIDLPGGRYAVSRYTGTAHRITHAWDALYRSWLPDSGYEPDDRPCLEVYRGTPQAGACPGPFTADLCVPVRPL